jgi:hypothetical protein
MLVQFCEAAFVFEAMGGRRLEVVCGPNLSATTSGNMEEKSCFDVRSWYIFPAPACPIIVQLCCIVALFGEPTPMWDKSCQV